MGMRGAQGCVGMQGAWGNVGMRDTQGCTGIQCTIGMHRDAGYVGTSGGAGCMRISMHGAQGCAGMLCTTGVQVAWGHVGMQGAQGCTEIQGTVGMRGAQGHIGMQGTRVPKDAGCPRMPRGAGHRTGAQHSPSPALLVAADEGAAAPGDGPTDGSAVGETGPVILPMGPIIISIW